MINSGLWAYSCCEHRFRCISRCSDCYAESCGVKRPPSLFGSIFELLGWKFTRIWSLTGPRETLHVILNRNIIAKWRMFFHWDWKTAHTVFQECIVNYKNIWISSKIAMFRKSISLKSMFIRTKQKISQITTNTHIGIQKHEDHIKV